MGLRRVQFEDSDHKYPKLEAVAEEIADFLFNYNSMFKRFNELMRISSKWTVHNYKGKLDKWCNILVGTRKKAAQDTLRLEELEKSFLAFVQLMRN